MAQAGAGEEGSVTREDDVRPLEERGCAWLFGPPGPNGNLDRVLVATDWPAKGELLVALCDALGTRGQAATSWVAQELMGLLDAVNFAGSPEESLRTTFRRLHVLVAEKQCGGTSGLVLVHLSSTRVIAACVGTARAAFVGMSAFRFVGSDPLPERSLGDTRYPPDGCAPNVIVADRAYGERYLMLATGNVWAGIEGDPELTAPLFAAADAQAALDDLFNVPALLPDGKGAAILVALRRRPNH